MELEFKIMHFSYFLLIMGLKFASIKTAAADSPRLQAVHVLDPEIEDFKYYTSWNSDQWISWLRSRYEQDLKDRRLPRSGSDSTGDELSAGGKQPLYGKWVNIILVTKAEDFNSAYSESSIRAYPNDGTRSDYYWSDASFPVYVIIRKSPDSTSVTTNNGTDNVDGQVETEYNVYSCTDKKMYVNAKTSGNFQPTYIETIFPKRVKNPKSTLRVPLTTCKKVRKLGLLDEIKFFLRN